MVKGTAQIISSTIVFGVDPGLEGGSPVEEWPLHFARNVSWEQLLVPPRKTKVSALTKPSLGDGMIIDNKTIIVASDKNTASIHREKPTPLGYKTAMDIATTKEVPPYRTPDRQMKDIFPFG